jgi:outer membrane protein, multidrug efflux system
MRLVASSPREGRGRRTVARVNGTPLRLSALLAPLMLGACNFAPEYAPPVIEMPTQFKEAHGIGWETARPCDDQPRGTWWRSFNDRVLDELEPQIDDANQDLAAALAALDQARSYVAKAQAALLPAVNLDNSYSINKQSQHRPLRKANTPFSVNGQIESWQDTRPLNEPDHYGDNLLTLQSSYEVDLWGRVRNSIAVGEANAEGRAAQMESIRLSLQAELARIYLALRGLDSEIKLLNDTIEAYKRALALTKIRVEGLIASPEDQARAEAQLEFAKAQVVDLLGQRAQLEHAIATLIGKPASSFTLRSASLVEKTPAVPPSVPSALLERRPDIAAEERQVAAANAQIGVARAAFFPRLMINLSGGTQDTGVSLLNMRNSIWSLGPSITLPIFDAGARAADLAGAEAAYLETVARYRGSVLRAIQEVEDSLANLRWLAKGVQSMETASNAANKVLDISLTLYRDGATNYLDVVTAQTAALEARRSVLGLKTRRQEAAVALMLALGGGWATPAPAPEQICLSH